MSYTSWFEQHSSKHKLVVDKLVLQGLNKEEIIEYFDFENMVKMESDFCPLYARNKKCHDVEPLNCYLCACPHFRFDDNGLDTIKNKSIKSKCSINAKKSSTVEHEDIIHLDCSACILPHNENYIKKIFSRDWFEMMSRVAPKPQTQNCESKKI